jgi:enolase
MEAIKTSGYEKEVKIGMDVAASEFFKGENKYDLDFKTASNDSSQVSYCRTRNILKQ